MKTRFNLTHGNEGWDSISATRNLLQLPPRTSCVFVHVVCSQIWEERRSQHFAYVQLIESDFKSWKCSPIQIYMIYSLF